MQIELPTAVHAYYTERRIQLAAQVLLSSKSPKVPENVEWHELVDFYRACLAAQQARLELPMALIMIWDAVWADKVKRWHASTFREMRRDNPHIKFDAESMWQSECFIRDLKAGGYHIDPFAEMDVETGIRVGIGLWHDDTMILPAAPTGIEVDDEYWYSQPLPLNQGTSIDLTPLAKAAEEMLSAIEPVLGS